MLYNLVVIDINKKNNFLTIRYTRPKKDVYKTRNGVA